jgi:hypothetical protein
MTDTDTAHSTSVTPMLQPAPNQRPSFLRWNDPIDRLPFLAHWLLSLALVIVFPLAVLWLTEKAGLGAMMLPLTCLAFLPAVQLYWVSSRRRLLDMGAKTGWLMLIFLFLALSAFNALDGFMDTGMAGANGPTLNRTVGTLLMLPAVILHFVLLFRRGRSALHRPLVLEIE